jgi:predicted dehydrogenase
VKILQIGLGSMGKRRIRNMVALGVEDILGFDPRADRRAEVEEKHGIKTVSDLTPELLADRDVWVLSTPPAHHLLYINLAIEHGKSAFVEASVVRTGLPEAAAAAEAKGVLIAPSCTTRFYHSVKTMKELVRSGRYGKVTNFSFIMGQYLPDWHPWEDIRDFYVSQRETSAAREMVPFEMTWIVDVVGWPSEVFAFRGQTMDMGVDIDDTYALSMRYDDGAIGSVMVDVVARVALREFVLNLERAQIRWSWEGKTVRLYDANNGAWSNFHDPTGNAAAGYNPNIIEEVYVSEMRAFLDAVAGVKPFPNTLSEDIRILEFMEVAEATNRGRDVGHYSEV